MLHPSGPFLNKQSREREEKVPGTMIRADGPSQGFSDAVSPSRKWASCRFAGVFSLTYSLVNPHCVEKDRPRHAEEKAEECPDPRCISFTLGNTVQPDCDGNIDSKQNGDQWNAQQCYIGWRPRGMKVADYDEWNSFINHHCHKIEDDYDNSQSLDTLHIHLQKAKMGRDAFCIFSAHSQSPMPQPPPQCFEGQYSRAGRPDRGTWRCGPPAR